MIFVGICFVIITLCFFKILFDVNKYEKQKIKNWEKISETLEK